MICPAHKMTDRSVCGVIHIRETKTRHDRDLPLSRDVGRALLAYLKRERPPSSYRTIFLQAIPPSQPFTDSSAISKIVRRALVQYPLNRLIK